MSVLSGSVRSASLARGAVLIQVAASMASEEEDVARFLHDSHVLASL